MNDANLRRCLLKEIPFLDTSHLGDRVIAMMPLWNGEGWEQWIPAGEREFVLMRPRDLGRGNYLATAPAVPNDLHIPFVELVWQHLSYKPVAHAATAIGDDFMNFAASLAKVDLFWTQRAEVGHGVAEFVRTEIEYTLVVARSVLDHLHDAMRGIWDNIQLVDAQANEKKKARGLPKKLSKMALANESPRRAGDFQERYALPPTFANFYEGLAEFLCVVRQLRDAVVHHGHGTGPVFVTEQGFGIARADKLAKGVEEIWTESHHFNDNVVSLRPLLAHLSLGCVYQTQSAAEAVNACIKLLPPIAPGLQVFTRGEHAATLIEAQAIHRGANPWRSPPPVGDE